MTHGIPKEKEQKTPGIIPGSPGIITFVSPVTEEDWNDYICMEYSGKYFSELEQSIEVTPRKSLRDRFMSWVRRTFKIN